MVNGGGPAAIRFPGIRLWEKSGIVAALPLISIDWTEASTVNEIWSETAFRERLTARATALGLSVAALWKSAGLDPSGLAKPPVQGRRLDTYCRIARACEWSLAETLGLAGPVDPALLTTAYHLAWRSCAAPAAAVPAPEVPELQAALYNYLASRPGMIDDTQALAALVKVLRQALQRP